MNYEGNPFQDCEAITLDALKNQADSLLNMAIEKQRSLGVSMKNGEKILLFPQNLVDPLCDNDFRLILLAAMRYAMGRSTYMPAVVADYIKRHIRLLDDKFLVLAADDIRRHLEDYAEHEPNPNLWQDLLKVIEQSREIELPTEQWRADHVQHVERHWKSCACPTANIHPVDLM